MRYRKYPRHPQAPTRPDTATTEAPKKTRRCFPNHHNETLQIDRRSRKKRSSQGRSSPTKARNIQRTGKTITGSLSKRARASSQATMDSAFAKQASIHPQTVEQRACLSMQEMKRDVMTLRLIRSCPSKQNRNSDKNKRNRKTHKPRSMRHKGNSKTYTTQQLDMPKPRANRPHSLLLF